MLTSVEIHPYYEDDYQGVSDPPIVLPLGDGGSYFIKNIDGLGPTSAEIVTSTYAGTPGGIYQTANVSMRNPVMQVAVNPDYSIDDPFGKLRRALYPYLNTSERVELRFVSDNMETVKTTAYLESFEPSIFSSDPMQTLSFVCPDPYFYSLTTITATRNNSGDITITNPGNARRTGFTAFFDKISTPGTNTLWINGTLDAHARYKDNKSVLTVGTYVSGNLMIFKVVTIQGQKYAGWMDSNTYHTFVAPLPDGSPNDETWDDYGNDLLGYIDGWAFLVPGENKFNIAMPVSGVGNSVFTLSFVPRYVGL